MVRMRPTGPFLSRRILLFTLTALFVATAFLPGALAKDHVDVTFGEPTKAYPDGDPGTFEINLAYQCTEFAPAGGDFTIDVSPDAGSASVADGTIPAKTLGADCTGETKANTTATVVADSTVKAGDPITVTVTVTPPSGDAIVKDTQVTVGPFVDVAFQANATSFTLAPGEATEETITIVSNSNDQVMVMTKVKEYPEGWTEPSLGTPMIEPAAGGSATGDVSFEVSVPSAAEPGDYTFVVSLFAHSTKEASIATEPIELSYVVAVEGSADTTSDGGDTEEGPGPAAPALLVGLLAALVGARRRDA